MEPLSASARERTPGAAVQHLGPASASHRAGRRVASAGAQSLRHRLAESEFAAPHQGAGAGVRGRPCAGRGAGCGHPPRSAGVVERQSRGRRQRGPGPEHRAAGDHRARRTDQSGFHVRQFRRGQEQSARQGRGHPGGRQSGQGLQPAVHLRRRGSRQDASHARGGEQAQRAQSGCPTRLCAQRALRRRHGQGAAAQHHQRVQDGVSKRWMP